MLTTNIRKAYIIYYWDGRKNSSTEPYMTVSFVMFIEKHFHFSMNKHAQSQLLFHF